MQIHNEGDEDVRINQHNIFFFFTFYEILFNILKK
jgi:hypothetical protein